MHVSERESIAAAARDCIDGKTKPPGSLGKLESLAVDLASIQCTLTPRIDPARVLIFAADHGVASTGVSAYPVEVTAQMMANFASGGAAVNVLAANAGADIDVVDVGVAADLSHLPGIHHAKVRSGSRNLVTEAAMSPGECEAALQAGREAIERAVHDGIRCVGLGEMGIGNTTSAAILTGYLCGADARTVTGRGTGVDDERLRNKRELVAARLQSLAALDTSPMQCLQRVGGLEIAALVGAMSCASEHALPVVVDGFIVTAAALLACREWPEVRRHLIFAHRSAEPGHAIALAALEADPLLQLDMRLGEGSAAALSLPLLRAAAAILRDMASFAEAGVSTQGDSRP